MDLKQALTSFPKNQTLIDEAWVGVQALIQSDKVLYRREKDQTRTPRARCPLLESEYSFRNETAARSRKLNRILPFFYSVIERILDTSSEIHHMYIDAWATMLSWLLLLDDNPEGMFTELYIDNDGSCKIGSVWLEVVELSAAEMEERERNRAPVPPFVPTQEEEDRGVLQRLVMYDGRLVFQTSAHGTKQELVESDNVYGDSKMPKKSCLRTANGENGGKSQRRVAIIDQPTRVRYGEYGY